MTRQHQTQQQWRAGDIASPARRVAAAPATPADRDSDSTAARAEAAPLDAAAGEAARACEAAIRAIGLDGIVLGGAAIRRLRGAAGLSSDALAARIGYSGALVRAWEAGRRSCPAHLYLPLVEAISTARREQAVLGASVTHMCFVAGHSAA